MKKRISILLSALVIMSAAAGCSRSSSSSQSGSTAPSPSSSESETVSIPDSARIMEEEDGGIIPDEEPVVDSDIDPTLQEVYEAVKVAYGENYVPSMAMEEQQLSEVCGINMENVDSYIAEGPLMSAHVDTFIGLKAVEGKGADVEKNLTDYQASLQEDALQYPMNMAKVNSSQVVRHGDYVFFVMLGAFDERGETTEEQQLEFAQEQTKIGVDTINALF